MTPRTTPRKTLPAAKVLLLAATALLLVPAVAAKHSVEITSGDPTEGTYTMTVDVSGFTLVDFADRDAKKGEGHIHYLINGKPCNPDGLPDDDADKCGDFYATPKTRFTFRNLDADDVVGAELVLSDHTASGTDASGTLNGARVLTEASVGGGNDAPGLAPVVLMLGLVGVALVLRRR